MTITGDADDTDPVYIIATDKKDPNDSKAKIWFEGTVDLDDLFAIGAPNAGETKLKAETYVFIYDNDDKTLLETIRFHTSCSQPLNDGDEFGSIKLVEFIPEHKCTSNDDCQSGGGNDCDAGKAHVLEMKYDGEDASASSHTQDPSKVTVIGDPDDTDPVYIIVAGKNDPNDSKAKIWFEGTVDLDDTFEINSSNAGESKLKAETYVFIFDNDDKTLLQTVRFHTSCSQPLNVGDHFGSLELVKFTPEDKDDDKKPGKSNGKGNGKGKGEVHVLEMKYDGEDASASNHTQDPSKVTVTGDPDDADPVYIIATDKKDPNDSKAKIWFEGTVDLDDTFEIKSSNAGESKLKAETYVFIYDNDNKTLLQTVRFHTSCSQPLNEGDHFGSLELLNSPCESKNDCKKPGKGKGKKDDGPCTSKCKDDAWGEGECFTTCTWGMYFKYKIQGPKWKLLNIPETRVTITTENQHPGYLLPSYFDTTLSNVPDGYSVTNGVYDGWCADQNIQIQMGEPYNVKLYLSTDPNLPWYAKDDEQWDYVNYILNQDYSSIGASWAEIQNAIWYFTEENPSLGSGGTEGYNHEIYLQIRDDALANGVDFIPGAGQWMAIICDPSDGVVKNTVQLTFIVVDP